MAQLFAAQHPERVDRLVLAQHAPRRVRHVAVHRDPDGSLGPSRTVRRRVRHGCCDLG